MTGTFLDQIVATKRSEVQALKERTSLPELEARARDLPPTRGFLRALREHAPEVALIAEIKKASPSKGVIRPDFDPVAIARAYAEGGATCLSVLTDETYFQGHLDFLDRVRQAVSLPLLRKDFLLDPIQVYQARCAGADAVLVIVAVVPSPARIAELAHDAALVGMDTLVEVHDARELGLAREAGATLIGINNRNLQTFDTRLETTGELLPHVPPGAIVVAESGISTRDDVNRLHALGAHAFLVGESLMRAADVAQATRTLLGQ